MQRTKRIFALTAFALFAFLFSAKIAHCQGARHDNITLGNSNGIARVLSGATVTVCASPGVTCTVPTTIYSDKTLTTTKSNPFTSDLDGNYFFYAPPGSYIIQVSGTGFTSYTYYDVVLPNDPLNPVFVNINGIRIASEFASTAAAFTDAGTTGAVLFPPGYTPGAFTNPNYVPVLDFTSMAWRGSGVNVKDFGAKGDGRSVSGLSVTSGNATLTDVADSPWEAGDVGKTIVLYGQTYAGFVTTIASVTDSQNIVLTAAPTASGSPVVTWGTDDSAAVAAAFASVTAKGGWGHLHFPHGIYLVGTALSIVNAQGLIVSGDGAASGMSLGNWNASGQPATGTAVVWIGAQGGYVGCQGNTGVPPPGIANATLNCAAAENFMLRLSGQFTLSDISFVGSQRASHNIQAGGPEASNSFNWRLERVNSSYARQYGYVIGRTDADQGVNFGEASLRNISGGGNGVPNTTVPENDATGGGDIFVRYGSGNFQISVDTAFIAGGASVNGSHHVFGYSGGMQAYKNAYFGPLKSGIYSSFYAKAGLGFTFEDILDENGYLLHSEAGSYYDLKQIQHRQQTTTNPHLAMLFDNVAYINLTNVKTSGLPIKITAGSRISQNQVGPGSLGPFPAYASTLCAGAGCTTRSGSDVTVTTTATCPYTTSDWVSLAGLADATYNGTFKVTTACSGGSTFHVTNAAAVGASTQGGTAGLACCVVADSTTNLMSQMSHPFLAEIDYYNGSATATQADRFVAMLTNLATKNQIVLIPATEAGAAGDNLPAAILAGWHVQDMRGGGIAYFGGPFQWGTDTNLVSLLVKGTFRNGPAVASFTSNTQGYLTGGSYLAFLNPGSTTLAGVVGVMQESGTNFTSGVYGEAETTHTAGTKNNVAGVQGDAYATGSGGTTVKLAGVVGSATQGSGTTVTGSVNSTGVVGVVGQAQVNSGATQSDAIYGVWAKGMNLDANITVPLATGVKVASVSKSTGTITTAVGVDVGNQTVGGTNYAIRTGTGSLSFGDVATTYGAETVAGRGLSMIRCVTSQKSESAADTNVLTCTPPATAGSYRLRFILSVSAANAATLGWTATWTDSNGTAQTPTNLALFQSGAAAPALTFVTSSAGNYYGEADIDVNNAGTGIVIKLTFTGTSFTAKASATVERII